MGFKVESTVAAYLLCFCVYYYMFVSELKGERQIDRSSLGQKTETRSERERDREKSDNK